MTLRTPLGRILGGSEAAVSRAFGKLAAYYVYFLAVPAAANVLAVPMLSQWIDTAVTYLPAFIAGRRFGDFVVSLPFRSIIHG